jgi:hypothetical protein
MINSVSSGMSMPGMHSSSSGAQKLTTEQQTLMSETLSQFDPDNLTEADALSIVETFSEAGIQPNAEFAEAMSELGYDAKEIGDLAQVSEEGQRPPPPPPPQQSSEEITSLVDYLSELVEETLATSGAEKLTDEDKESILAQVFEEFNIEDQSSIINTSV